MNRRDFLLFRRTRHAKIVEIPCERIYMHYLGAAVTARRTPDDRRDDSMPGEPAPEFVERTTRDVLDTLDTDLQDVDVVRVIDRHWLASDVLTTEFDAFLAAFIARGGRVEFVDGGAASDSSQSG
jgi:hypothetical protein